MKIVVTLAVILIFEIHHTKEQIGEKSKASGLAKTLFSSLVIVSQSLAEPNS